MKLLTFIFSMLLLIAFMTAGAQTISTVFPVLSDVHILADVMPAEPAHINLLTF